MYRSLKWQRLKKITLKNRGNLSFRWFVIDIMASIPMFQWKSQAHVAPKLHGAHLEGSIIPRDALQRLHNSVGRKFIANLPPSFKAFEGRLVELCSLWSAPRGVLEQCNMCPAFSWKQSYGGLDTHTNILYLGFFFLLKVIFVNHCHFRDLHNQYNNF